MRRPTARRPAKKPAKAPAGKRMAGNRPDAAELRERQFVEAYIANGGNKTAAAIQAGAPPAGAHVQGSRLFQRVKDSGLLEQRRAELMERLGLDTEDVVRRLSAQVKADITMLLDAKGNILPPGDWPAEIRGAVKSMEWTKTGPKVTLHDTAGAIRDAMKHLGLFERDNRQRADPIASLLAAIQERGSGLRVVP